MPASEREQQILDAAEVVFAASGYSNVGTAGVAAEAGVSEPTLYRYFDSKRDLYLAMLDRNAERLLATWQQIADESPAAMTGLAEIGARYFQQLTEDPFPFLLRARSLLETGDELVAAHARKHFWATFEFVEGLYERARAGGEIAADTDARSQAWLFMAVGGLLDQFLLMGIEGLDGAELGRMMAVVGPRPAEDSPAAPRAVVKRGQKSGSGKRGS